jgi:hypothetical protein
LQLPGSQFKRLQTLCHSTFNRFAVVFLARPERRGATSLLPRTTTSSSPRTAMSSSPRAVSFSLVLGRSRVGIAIDIFRLCLVLESKSGAAGGCTVGGSVTISLPLLPENRVLREGRPSSLSEIYILGSPLLWNLFAY